MKVKFKSPMKIDGVMFPVGTHEVPDHFAGHWFLLAQKANKKLQVLGEPKASKKLEDVAPEQEIVEPIEEAPKKKGKKKKDE